MTYTSNLTDETKALLQTNNVNPVAIGANQYLKQATPRLNAVNMYHRPQAVATQAPTTQTQNTSSADGIGGLVNGGVSLLNGLNSLGVFNGGGGESFLPQDSEETKINDKASDYGDLLSSGMSFANMAKGWGNSGGSAAGSGAGGAMGGYGGLIMGGINGLSSFAQSGDYKDGVQGVFSIDKDDSDVMQSIKGTVNGALMGGQAGGPWGALAGGILGLGSSFLDDI